MDLAGLAPASSGVNTEMLLYTLQAQGPQDNYKQKEPLFQETPFVNTRLWSVMHTEHISKLSIANQTYMSSPAKIIQ